MPKTLIYHNPRCSKSRATLQLLRDKQIEPAVVNYLDTPPGVKELDKICNALGIEPLQLIRTKEKRFAELGLSKKDRRSRQDWLRIMHENPILIERPVIMHEGRYALGRPPEAVLEIL